MKAISISVMCSLLIATGRSAFYSQISRRSLVLAVVVKPLTIFAAKPIPKRTSFVLGAILMTAAASNLSSVPTNCQKYPFPDEAVELDTYNGVELKVAKLRGHVDPTKFAQDLKSSLDLWIDEGKRGIWIYIPTHMAHLVPSCIDSGFDFHFAKKGNLVLTRWLPNTPSRLPLGPTHQVGVGCFVIHPNDDKLMLVVQEKTGPAAKYGLWKMPTGLLDPSEDIAQGAVRELKEETGLDGEMDAIMTFRQAHPGGDRGSDLFFICKMKLSCEVSQIQKQEEEIAAIKWMTFDEYANQELWQNSPLYQKMNQVMMATLESGFTESKLEVGFRPGMQTMYLPKSSL